MVGNLEVSGGFIPRIQGWFNIKKPINVTLNIKSEIEKPYDHLDTCRKRMRQTLTFTFNKNSEN